MNLKRLLGIQLLLIFVLGALLSGYQGFKSHGFLEEAYKIRLKDLIRVAYSVMEFFHQQELEGRLSREEAQKLAKEVIRHLRYGPDMKDYFFVITDDPREVKMVMHPYKPQLEGKDITHFKDKKGNELFKRMAEICRSNGEGFLRYFWQYKDQKDRIEAKLTFVKRFSPWGWIVGTGFYEVDFKGAFMSMVGKVLLVSAAVLVVLVAVFAFSVKRIVNDINILRKGLQRLKSGIVDVEFSSLKLREFGEIAEGLNGVCAFLKEVLLRLKKNATIFVEESRKVKASSQEASRRMEDVSNNTERLFTTLNHMIDSIKEEEDLMSQISSAVQEISENTTKTSVMTTEAVEKAEKTARIMDELDRMAEGVSSIVKLINDIAEQTNLLALNATIEAARAGEAGRGFAVVANEVKELAKQTAEATGEITQKLSAIREKSRMAVEATKEIGEIIQNINQNTTTIASAIEEHTAVMGDVASKIKEQASSGEAIQKEVNATHESIKEAVEYIKRLGREISKVEKGAEELREVVKKFQV